MVVVRLVRNEAARETGPSFFVGRSGSFAEINASSWGLHHRNRNLNHLNLNLTLNPNRNRLSSSSRAERKDRD